MGRLEKQGLQQKKLRKPSSSSRRSTSATATASLGNMGPADGPGAGSPSTGAPASAHLAPAFWPATSRDTSFTVDSTSGSSEWYCVDQFFFASSL